MIDINKSYRTRHGLEVRIYAIDGSGRLSIHGAMKTPDGWVPMQWPLAGRWTASDSPFDLIEVKPRIKKAVWLHVFKDGNVVAAVDPASYNITHRIACVKVEIDCEEGEGL